MTTHVNLYSARQCTLVLGVLLSTAINLPAHPNHYPAVIAPALPALPIASAAAAKTADARLSFVITDAQTRQRTPVRVRILDAAGHPLGLALPPGSPAPTGARLAIPGTVAGLPAEAIGILYGPNDSAQGFAFQPNGAFYVNGGFELPVPAGKYRVILSKGYEYERRELDVELKPGARMRREAALKRWADMPSRGWYSSDDHIHLRRSPRENPLILDWIAAEDIHVGVLLQMGDFWTTYFSQYGWGEKGRYGKGHHLLASGQEEPRTSELGHTISLGAEQFVRFPDDYYSYDRFFDRIHELGGVSGYAHQGMTFHGHRGLSLDVLTRKIDFMEMMQFCASEGPLALKHYYHFLDLGFRITALGGSDFPWCGRSARFGLEHVGPQIGDARFYTYVGHPFSFEKWLAGIKAGHTFVSSGPVLEFKVNNQLPGSTLDLKRGARVRVTARAGGHATQIPLQRLQIIGHGRVLAEIVPGNSGQTAAELTLDRELEIPHGIWLAARADAGKHQVAHTTPVYLTVEGDGFHNRERLDERIATTRGYLQEIRDVLRPPATMEELMRQPARGIPPPWRYRTSAAHLERRIVAAEKVLEEIRSRR